ncbi:MAG: right-handed parallel beta-helix repeat-containing protein [archaeon]
MAQINTTKSVAIGPILLLIFLGFLLISAPCVARSDKENAMPPGLAKKAANAGVACVNLSSVTAPYYLNNDTTLCAGNYVFVAKPAKGVLVFNATNITLDCSGANITGSTSVDGIYTNFSGSTVKNCILHGYRYNIYSSSADGVVVENNTLYSSKRGVFLEASSSAVVKENTITGNNYGVFASAGSNSAQITGNKILLNLLYGIYNNNSNYTSISDNVFLNNTNKTLLYVDFGEIYSNVSSGLQISGNSVLDHRFSGFGLDNCNDCVVGFNNFTPTMSYYSVSIIATDCSNLSVIGNLFNSTFTNAGYSLIATRCTGSSFANNTFASSRYGISLRGTDSSTVENNVFYKNSLVGILLQSESFNITIRYNTMLNNLTNVGIAVLNSTNNEVYKNLLDVNNGINVYDMAHQNSIHDNYVKFSNYGFWFETTNPLSYFNENNTISNNTFLGGQSCLRINNNAGANNFFEGNTLKNCSYAVDMYDTSDSNGLYIRSNKITNSRTSAFYSSKNSVLFIYDTKLDSSNVAFHASAELNSTVRLVNTTYNTSKTILKDTSTIRRGWYSVVRAIHTNGTNLSGASVSSIDFVGSPSWNATTGSSGRTSDSWPWNIDYEYEEFAPGGYTRVVPLYLHIITTTLSPFGTNTATFTILANEVDGYNVTLPPQK